MKRVNIKYLFYNSKLYIYIYYIAINFYCVNFFYYLYKKIKFLNILKWDLHVYYE